eukprot:TRINITY_DN15382_c0_g1_i1.p1 TRINITY_DN15382_c0_g1~~TRINITY_DN15382_c0_g1_i1.p1  ORF type:complete len:172 (-),score=33.98 TRINITY_DN15382_c0_g1_i1:14-481(-)
MADAFTLPDAKAVQAILDEEETSDSDSSESSSHSGPLEMVAKEDGNELAENTVKSLTDTDTHESASATTGVESSAQEETKEGYEMRLKELAIKRKMQEKQRVSLHLHAAEQASKMAQGRSTPSTESSIEPVKVFFRGHVSQVEFQCRLPSSSSDA